LQLARGSPARLCALYAATAQLTAATLIDA